MTDLLTLKQRLLDAENALHRLMIGELEVSISVGGFGTTSYAQTDIAKLKTYIAELKMDIAKSQGRPRRKPIFFKF